MSGDCKSSRTLISWLATMPTVSEASCLKIALLVRASLIGPIMRSFDLITVTLLQGISQYLFKFDLRFNIQLEDIDEAASAEMFANSGKGKPLAQVLREKNSKGHFGTDVKPSAEKLLNQSLSSVQNDVKKKAPVLKQTKLCIRRSLKRSSQHEDGFIAAEQLETKSELFIMPLPKAKYARSNSNLNATVCGGEEQPSTSRAFTHKSSLKEEKQDENKKATVTNPLNQRGRKMVALTSGVEFLIKTCKLYKNLDALWNVYGKLIRYTKGKIRFEHILLMRNIDGTGPVLQCVYFDFNDTLKEFSNGCVIRAVGNFNDTNRLRAFKVRLVNPSSVNAAYLHRIQNINSFVLLQAMENEEN
uniref:Uncharacterized protein n=1 Tax=Glossina morsitans morsitans TaxID=37546 RepID=A0A1B0G1H0_GLOMM